jgi:hypothetical protein
VRSAIGRRSYHDGTLARVTLAEYALLAGAGFAAGAVNSIAGGGSLLTVPLLVLLGLPGGLANGTNRVGILLQSAVSAWRFRSHGVSGGPDALPLLLPVSIGSAAGAFAISRLADDSFERMFGVVMLVLLVPILRGAGPRAAPPRMGSRLGSFLLFLGIGAYGGAFQAGIGIPLLYALAWSGHDLVRANSIKAVVIFALTAVAVPVFVLREQIAWAPAAALGLGFLTGGELGARLALHGGERLIRPVLVAAVVALSGRMLGLW